MSRARWSSVEKVLDRHGIRPIVAVIPENRDPKLLVDSPDDVFWDKMRMWRDKQWQIALHGFTHEYTTREGGLVPINRQSEFAGVSLEVQREKLRAGRRVFEAQGLPVSLWVAPSHSFDQATLTALQEETPIRVISDGISISPFSSRGFTWIPQQLWAPREMRCGVWTICLHPNTISETLLQRLDQHMARHAGDYIGDLSALVARFERRSQSVVDRLFSCYFFWRRNLRSR